MMPATRRSTPRPGLALVGVLLAVFGAAALSPAIPGVRAGDSAADASASVSPDPGSTPTVPPEPSAAPTTDPVPDPTTPPDGTPTPIASEEAPTVEPSADPSSEPSPSPTASPKPTPVVEVVHTWVDRVDADGGVASTGAADRGLAWMERFVVYRIRFQVLNSGRAPIDLTPTLESAAITGPGAWAAVPQVDPVPGQPFYAASDDGAVFRARTTAIPPVALRLASGPSPDYRAVTGVASSGRNPSPAITLAPRTFTEVEFAVRATVDAAWTQSYSLRLGLAPASAAVDTPVVVTMRPRPPIVLTMPMAPTVLAPASSGNPWYQLAVARSGALGGPAYPLAALVDPDSPHVESSLTSDSCAACHATHRAPAGQLLDAVYRASPLRSSLEPYRGADFALCLVCHQEAPFADTSGSPSALTRFPGHGFHAGLITGKGTGGQDITVPGDGQGNALCAECHYNLHAVPTSERGLVRFAPDVLPYDGPNIAHSGQLVYDPASGSCTLTCHGRPHDGLTFESVQPGP